MSYRELIDRQDLLKKLHSMADENRALGGWFIKALTAAMLEVSNMPECRGWIDVGDPERPPQDGVMVELEITEGDWQSVERGWWDEQHGFFRNTKRIFSREVVTGWQKLPAPRREKCLRKS